MEVQIGVSKIGRFDYEENHETFEIIERPYGGQSLVLCKAKNDGTSDKEASSLIVNKTIGTIAEGRRDSIAIKQIAEYVFKLYSGNIKAALGIISADFETNTIVVSRCMEEPVYYMIGGNCSCWQNGCTTIGQNKVAQPSITEIPIAMGETVVMMTEGVHNAGKAFGKGLEIPVYLQAIAEETNELNARMIADHILHRAIELDQGSPLDEMTVVVLRVCEAIQPVHRRIMFAVPIPKYDE